MMLAVAGEGCAARAVYPSPNNMKKTFFAPLSDGK